MLVTLPQWHEFVDLAKLVFPEQPVVPTATITNEPHQAPYPFVSGSDGPEADVDSLTDSSYLTLPIAPICPFSPLDPGPGSYPGPPDP